MGINNLGFVLRYRTYEDNIIIFLSISLRMNPSSKHISVEYNWFEQQVGKEFLIRIRRQKILPKVFKLNCSSVLRQPFISINTIKPLSGQIKHGLIGQLY